MDFISRLSFYSFIIPNLQFKVEDVKRNRYRFNGYENQEKYGKTGGLHPEYVENFNINEMRQ